MILFTACSHTNNVTPVPVAHEHYRYERKLYKHWTDDNKNCLNTRDEILKARSIGPVMMKKKGCKVISGVWEDYYYDETLTEAKLIDIDHIVPLKNAHESGAFKWNAKEREAFANDPENLVITNKRYNRQKGAKGIDSWLPVNKDYACKYLKDWIKIKTKYKLLLSLAEMNSINALKYDCGI